MKKVSYYLPNSYGPSSSPRLDLPHVPQHIVQRGNNLQPIFFHEDDYGVYLEYLCGALVKNNCRLYAFVLMTNHVHLLALGETSSGVPV